PTRRSSDLSRITFCLLPFIEWPQNVNADWLLVKVKKGSEKAVRRLERCRDLHPAPQGASDFGELTVSLKRYPDTNLILIRSSLAMRAARLVCRRRAQILIGITM